ncbi:MAG: hypothetical protein ACI37J_03150 [Candidatus Bruticola sp.]
MNYRYGILATALAVGLFAVPATAGVTDVTGGSTTTVNTTVRNNYTDTKSYVTNEKHLNDKVVNKTVDKSGGTKYIVKGTVTYYGKINGNSDHRSETKTYEYTTTNPSDVSTLKGWVSSNLRDYGFDRQKNRYGLTSGQLNTMYHLNNSTYMGSSYNYSGWSSSESGSVKTSTSSSRQKNTTNKYTEYKENKSKMTTTYDGSKLTYTGTTYEPGTILVGDPDSIFNAYTANGKATINEIRDDYYTRNHVYERDHITQDTVTNTTTKTGTKTVVYQMNSTRVYSPIVLDLDGDGKIEASNGQYLAHDSFSDKVVAFDFFGNGFPVLTEWVGANDGLLCRPNADGSVKGTNLFGIANGFDNGYEEMASLDVDNSGSLEGAELKELRVWTDVNANGIAEANELKTLDELGITSIKVSHNNYASTFVRNGQTFKSFDWWPNCREMRKVDMASVIK